MLLSVRLNMIFSSILKDGSDIYIYGHLPYVPVETVSQIWR